MNSELLETMPELMGGELDILLEALPMPVFFKTTDLRYRRVNRALREFFGRSGDDILGLTDRALFPAVDMGHHAALENERRTVDEERLLAAAVFEQCEHGVVVTDASWRILRINPAFAAITGLGEQAALGQALDRIVAKGQDEAQNWRMWQELRENGAWRGETTTRRPDGAERSLRLRIGAIRDLSGNTRQYIGFVDGG